MTSRNIKINVKKRWIKAGWLEYYTSIFMSPCLLQLMVCVCVCVTVRLRHKLILVFPSVVTVTVPIWLQIAAARSPIRQRCVTYKQTGNVHARPHTHAHLKGWALQIALYLARTHAGQTFTEMQKGRGSTTGKTVGRNTTRDRKDAK